MAEDDMEKTEAATPRRRQDAREDGSVARSADLTAACALLGAVVLLHFFGMRLLGFIRSSIETTLSTSHISNPTRLDDLGWLNALMGRVFIEGLIPLVLCITAIALVVTVAQVGFVVSTKTLEPNITKLSPLKGLKNLFGMRAGIRVVSSVGKVVVIGAVAAMVILTDMPYIVRLHELEMMPMFGVAADMVYDLALKLAVILMVLAVGDYALQRLQHERDLRMSKQEIKEEMKRMEGDPLIKQRRARVARQLAMSRMSQAVPQADVVVTNPTHFAVALKYDSKAMGAPRVVAKGADLMAMRIRQIATANGVPLVERKEIARALYREVEIGQEVPAELYAAVAEILAYVYRMSGRKTA